MRTLAALVLAVSVSGAVADTVDPRVRTYVDPVRVVWTQTVEKVFYPRFQVITPERLIAAHHGQIPELGWKDARDRSRSCVLVNSGVAPGLMLDFGRELHGGLRLGVGSGPQGMKVRVRFGESVAEAMAEIGEKGATNDHAIRDDVITAPGMGTVEIGNTGFRFARIDLVTPGTLALEFVQAVELMRPMERKGYFRCPDERLNRIFDTAARTVHLCCQDYLWDGIKRDRLVWMGDAHSETMVILNVFGAASVLPETLDNVIAITPAGEWANTFPTYTLCFIRNFAEWYRYTGDRKYLERHGDYLARVFEHVRANIPDGKWRKQGQMGAFLDWPTHHNPDAELAGAQALAALAVEDMKFLLGELGRKELVKSAEETLAAMRRTKPDPHGAKSAAAMLALSGLREPKEMFAEVLGVNGHEGVSTFYGYYMIEAMAKAGENRRALDTVRDYWGAMLDVGATSFWEDFKISWTNNCSRIDEMPVKGKKDIHGDYGEFCYPGFRHSFCHGWSGGPAAYLINHVLGIRPLTVGCTEVEVKPDLADLKWAEGAMALPGGGAVKVRAEKGADGRTDVKIEAPDGVRIVR